MRERQYSFLFRGNRPSTPSAGNTAHDFARSCRKLDLSERVFGAFLAQINDVSSCVRIVQEFRAVENEAQRWDLIAEEANSPMHQYAWVKACTDAFATCGELQLIVVGADQPRALGPFIMRSGPLNRMECLGVAELYEPTDFPYSDFDSLACLIDALVRMRRPDYPCGDGLSMDPVGRVLDSTGRETQCQPPIQLPPRKAQSSQFWPDRLRSPLAQTARAAAAAGRKLPSRSCGLERAHRLRAIKRSSPPAVLRKVRNNRQ